MKLTKSLFKRVLLNSQGFSLAEVMVGAGMLGVVTLGLMKMTDQQNQVQKKMRIEFNTTGLLSELSVLNKRESACQNTLNTIAGGNLTSLPVNVTLRDHDNNILLNNGDVYGRGSGGAVTVTSLQITSSTPAISTSGAPRTYTLVISMNFSKNGISGPQANFSKTMSMNFADNDGNGIIDFAAGDSCVTQSVETSLVCEALGGVVVTSSGTERCANIDLFNNESDSSTPGESRYFGVMARGGVAITEDTASPGTGAVSQYWSITPTDVANSRLQFRNDNGNQPNGVHRPILELVSSTDGSINAIQTYADKHFFHHSDGTRRILITTDGLVSVGTVTSPNAKLHVEATDTDTEDVIKIVTNVNNSDIRMDGAGALAAETSLFINIDADNNGTGNRLDIGTNHKGNGNTNLFTVLEDNSVGIGTVSPNARLEVVGSGDTTMIVRTVGASENAMIRLRTDDQHWLIGTLGISNDDFWIYNESTGQRSIQIDKADNGIIIGHHTADDAAGSLDVYGGHIYLYQTSNAIDRPTTVDCQIPGTPGNQNCRVAHKAFVYRALSGALSTDMTAGQRQLIVEHLLNTTTTGNWGALKTDFLNDINAAYDSALTGGNACPSGLFVERIRYYANGRIRFDCGNPLGCGSKENCSNVYAGVSTTGKFCMRNGGGDYDCVSPGINTWPNNCSNVTSTATGFSSARTAACTGDKMVQQFLFLSDGRIRLVCCNNEITRDE